MDLQRTAADIASSLVDTNELSEPLFDFRRDDTGAVLVDVYEPEMEGEGDLPVYRTYRVGVVLTDPVEAPATAIPAQTGTDHDDLFTVYAAALDEIYALRTAAAYEATLLERLLELKTFPAGRRQATVEQRDRLVSAAGGNAPTAYTTIPSADLRAARTEAGMSQLLTANQFEEGLRDR